VVETEADEAEEEEPREEEEDEEIESAELVEVIPKTPVKSKPKEPVERTDDPLRMYLREMGSIGLLSRQGEVATAKRIEAGREAMIAGLCESPLTFQAVIIWRDELNGGKVFLHDIIDLEATYAGPDAKAVPAAVPGVDVPPAAPTRAPPFLLVVPPQPVASPSAPPAPRPSCSARHPRSAGSRAVRPALARCRRAINFREGPPLNWYFCEVWIGPWETDETADGVLGTGSRPLGIDHSRS
jgi:RNA polymerase primary sigma factor